MSDSITADLFAKLNILLLERLEVGTFKTTGTIPDWLQSFCVNRQVSGMEVLVPKEQFPFLENFLFDAEDFWRNNQEKSLKSGVWTDYDLRGREYHFEASAVCLNDKKILLIEKLEEDYDEKLYLIQKARENNLSYQQSIKENQKKDVLIHCIIHDMAGQLSGINCCFALLEMENLTPEGKERLAVGKKQSLKQEMLIRDILDAFSHEVQSLENFKTQPDLAPDIFNSAQEVIQLLSPSFALNKINLQLAPQLDTTANWKVIGDISRLDRVIANLIENALRHSPANSTVTLGLQQDENNITLTVDDEGQGVPEEVAHNLFQKFSQGKGNSGRIGLGLYFCRITIQRWGGDIGYSLSPQGGSRFWFRLPKAEMS